MKQLLRNVKASSELNPEGEVTFTVGNLLFILQSIEELKPYDISFQHYYDGTIELLIGDTVYTFVIEETPD